MILDIKREDITSDLLDEFISKDMLSENKKSMEVAHNYMNANNEAIMNRRKVMFVEDGSGNMNIVDDLTKANYKAPHTYLNELVSQCTNYLVGKPLKIDFKNAFDEEAEDGVDYDADKVGIQSKADVDKETLDNVLNRGNDFSKFLQKNVSNLQVYGTTYFRVVLVEGVIKFVTYDPREIIMFKNDFNENHLCIRYFEKDEIVTEGKKKPEIKPVKYVEVFDHTHKDVYKKDKGKWEKVESDTLLYKEVISYGEGDTQTVEEQGLEVHVFPVIEWQFNDEKRGTLSDIKPFIDFQDINLGDLANNVEDIQDAIWVLENYNGQGLDEFMTDLKFRKSVKVGNGGRARPETIDIPIQARKELYDMCERNIYKFGFGINFSDRDSLGNVTGVALKWSYAPLEQKANAIETHAQSALNDLFNVLFTLLDLSYDSNDIEYIFDRSMIANELEKTQMVMSTSSVLSQKTIIDNIPFVTDTEDELKRLGEENEYTPDLSIPTDEVGDDTEEPTEQVDGFNVGNNPIETDK